MKNLKITKGEWSVAPNGNIYRRNYKDIYEYGGSITGEFPVAYTTYGNPQWENKYNREANAQLIGDAGTTANKCGKLPSELLAERDELLSALRSCVLSMQAHPDCEENSEFEGFVNKGWEIINKTI